MALRLPEELYDAAERKEVVDTAEGRIRHPLCTTTPHYARIPGIVKDQLKAARLLRPTREAFGGAYGNDYANENARGPEAAVDLSRGDVFYFPAGMWSCIEIVGLGVSLNALLMGITYAMLARETLRYLMGVGGRGDKPLV